MIGVKKLLEQIASRKDIMVQDLVEISRIPSINPRMNGQGEYRRMQWIKGELDKYNIPCRIIEVKDEAVKEGIRLNLISTFPGTENREKTLWVIAHVDTVHPGDLSLWRTDPFNPKVMDGKVYGLGVEDNTQAVIVGMHIARLLQETGTRAKCNIGFIFVSDEETGSKYGLHALLEQNVFSSLDEAIVPDGGSPDGDFVEIAEKSQVWLRFTVNGKQAHAAMPDLGINACSIGMHLGVEVEDMLKREFDYKDNLFNPPYSTFELTQKFANVESPNVLPGQDMFTIDMRILPKYSVDEVMGRIRGIAEKYEQAHKGVSIKLDFVTRVDAPSPTGENSQVVENLLSSLRELGVNAYCGGIGGGTCAAILRSKKIPVVVWSTVDEMAHQPNEYAVIDNLVKDAQVLTKTILKYC